MMQRLTARMSVGDPTEKAQLSAEIDRQIFSMFDFTQEECSFVSSCVPKQ